MGKRTISLTSDWFKIIIIIIVSILIGGVLFLINGLSNLLNVLLYIIQSIFGIIFAVWYFRIFLIFIKEIRKKEPKKKIGIPLGWSIYGLIVCLFNILVWGLFSPLVFNFPKIIFLVPTALMFVEISYIFIKANRRRLRDWLIFVYNIMAILYLLNWTLIDFGFDFPNFLGVFEHTLNSSIMFWQFIFLNTSAFIMPTFLFPPFLFNPRYYFAMPVEKYLKLKEAENQLKSDIEEQIPKEALLKEKPVIGERKPYFEERKLQKEQSEESLALSKEIAKKYEDDDVKYAEHIGSNDLSFRLRKVAIRLDNFLRTISLSIILILIVITPFAFS